MTTRARTHANRMNARRSTGPRTPAGLVRSSQNALKIGLFSKLLVIAALGETADELDRFRAAVSSSLAPLGAVEEELAARAAGLMWRLRRVAQYEAAVLSAPSGPLPPHPDEVRPLEGDACFRPVPADAPTSFRLAHLRNSLRFAPASIGDGRAAVAVFGRGANPTERLSYSVGANVQFAAAEELGWVLDPDPWGPALAAAGFRNTNAHQVKWTAARFRRLLRFAADGAGRDRGEFLKAVRARLRTKVAALERLTAEREQEEVTLVAQMNAERARAVAARMYADEALVQRVARAESHLSRELDRALLMLERLQAGRDGNA